MSEVEPSRDEILAGYPSTFTRTRWMLVARVIFLSGLPWGLFWMNGMLEGRSPYATTLVPGGVLWFLIFGVSYYVRKRYWPPSLVQGRLGAGMFLATFLGSTMRLVDDGPRSLILTFCALYLTVGAATHLLISQRVLALYKERENSKEDDECGEFCTDSGVAKEGGDAE